MLKEWSPHLSYRITDEGTAIGVYEIKQRQIWVRLIHPGTEVL